MKIMFDYEILSEEEINDIIQKLNVRIVRWMAMYHPTNWVRVILYRKSNVQIGRDVVINPRLMLFDDYRDGLIKIGDRVSIASDVTIIAVTNPNNSFLSGIPYVRDHLIKSDIVTIKEDVWIGSRAIVFPGVTIGEMSIIGSSALVTKDVPPYSVVKGIPAKVVRKIEK
jgi:maltose O-acetyltransferase